MGQEIAKKDRGHQQLLNGNCVLGAMLSTKYLACMTSLPVRDVGKCACRETSKQQVPYDTNKDSNNYILINNTDWNYELRN